VLTPSTFSANVFKSNNIENIVVANNPVNFSNEKSQVNPQSIEFLKNEIVFLGRFVEEKGVYDFCDEIISNKNYYKNVKVNLIGDGPEKNSIISMLEEHGIDFTDFGFCDKGRVKRILLNSNVIVVPSIWDETFGLVVAEAIFNFCIPVVSNR
ncbi:glycosyltransferase, partial [Vibrio fluvialis]|uniref:glycosyltransferase n=2 Tax=Vibrionaceae TaxID=641 RepID=UPI001EEBC355